LTVTLVVYDDLVDTVNPGDRVDVTGMYRAQPIQSARKMRTLRAIYKTYVDVIHFRKTERATLGAARLGESSSIDDTDQNTATSTKPTQEMLQQLAQAPDIYDRLTRSLGMRWH
jgi:DNA replication licensing factor MCM4